MNAFGRRIVWLIDHYYRFVKRKPVLTFGSCPLNGGFHRRTMLGLDPCALGKNAVFSYRAGVKSPNILGDDA
jgi:hypothetical protein